MRKESSDDVRRQIHLKVQNLWKQRHQAGSELESQAKQLKREIEQYKPWDACTLFCPINPYWKYTDLTERIREMITLGIAKRRRDLELEAGIRRGESAAEFYRGEPTTTEQAAAIALNPVGAAYAAITGAEVPGGGKLILANYS